MAKRSSCDLGAPNNDSAGRGGRAVQLHASGTRRPTLSSANVTRTTIASGPRTTGTAGFIRGRGPAMVFSGEVVPLLRGDQALL